MNDDNNEKCGFTGFFSEVKDSLDVVWIGSSESFVYWAPYEAWKEQGIASYVIGRSSMRPMFHKFILEDVMKYQSPNLVIIGLRPFIDFNGNVEEASLRNYSDLLPCYSPSRIGVITDSFEYTPEGKRLLSTETAAEKDQTKDTTHKNYFTFLPYYFDIMKYHGNWNSLCKNSWMNNGRLGTITSPTKGYLLVEQHEKIGIKNNSDIHASSPIAESSEKYLRELISELQRYNVNALFVLTPYTESEEVKMRYNYCERTIHSSGFDCIDLNDYIETMGINASSDFYNSRHTNIFGSEKVTSFLANYICDHYNIPNRQNDSNYLAWNAGYEEWKQLSDKTKNTINNLIAMRKE